MESHAAIPTPTLYDSIHTIRSQYSNPQGDAGRMELIELLESLPKECKEYPAENVMQGALLYATDTIANTYRLTSPRNSRLYCILMDSFHPDAQTTPKKIIYLADFYLYAQQAKLPAKVLSEIEGLLKYLLQSNEATQILQHVLSKRPDYSKFKPVFASIHLRYKHGYSNPERVNDIYLIDFISKISSSKNDLQVSPNKLMSETPQFAEQTYHNIYFGVILYLMTKIEEGYYIRSAANSDLYRLCQQAINADSTKSIPDINKIAYLTAVLHLISDILQMPNKEDYLKQYALSENYLTKVQTQLSELTNLLTQEKAEPHRLGKSVGRAINKAFKLTVNGVAGYAVNSMYQLNVVSNGSAMLVGYFWGGPAALIVSQVAPYIEKQIMPDAITAALQQPLGQVAALLGCTVEHAIDLPIQGAYFFHGLLRTKRVTENNSNDIQAIANRLVRLPNDIIPKDTKDKLHYLYNTTEMTPVQIPIVHSATPS